jgi:YD repeat-containing protein
LSGSPCRPRAQGLSASLGTTTALPLGAGRDEADVGRDSPARERPCVRYSDTTPDVTFAYDGNGNRTQMSDGSGTESYGYDAVDRLESVTRGTNTFSYAYDAAGNVTRRTYPDSTVVNYAYDDDGRLASRRPVRSAATCCGVRFDPAPRHW